MIQKDGMPVLLQEFHAKFENKELTHKRDRRMTLNIYEAFCKNLDMRVTWPLRFARHVRVLPILVSV